MADPIDLLLEVFTWLGFGVGILLGVIALILFLLDGTWLPVRAVVEVENDKHVLRWFDHEGDVNEAPVPALHLHEVEGRTMVDIFYRQGWRHRMRFTRRAPVVRATSLLSVAFLGIGIVALVISLVMLFAAG